MGLPSPSAAAVPASTVFFFPEGLPAWTAVGVVIIPALLMVSTMKYRSFKSVDLGEKRSYRGLIAMAAVFAAIAARPHEVLITMAYTYMTSAFVEAAVTRMRGGRATPAAS